MPRPEGTRPGSFAIESSALSLLEDNGFEGLALLLLFAAAGAFGLFALVLGALWAASFPRLPDAGPETTDLGPEPPAISNLLVHRFKVTHAAMAATLLDLAARGYVGIDLLGRNNYVIRIRDRGGDSANLTGYEAQIFNWVKSQATGGSAPFEALSVGSPGQAAGFWKRFESSVVSDARKRGLVRSRWAKRDWVILGTILAFAFGFLALSLGAAGVGDSGEDPMNAGDWLLIAGFGWFGVLAVITRFQDLRDTKHGQEVAGRWLGVRNALKKSTAFNDAPPSHVTIWGQNLSHAVAMGLAHEAVRQLPFDEEDPETAWTRQTGVWREITISYPSRFGWGEKPLWVLWGGIWRVAVWGGLAFFVVPVASSILFDIISDIRTNNSEQIGEINPLAINGIIAIIVAFIGGWTIFLLVRFTAGLIRLWRALNDLGKAPIVTEGQVVKLYEGRIAVDDGILEETKAWTLPPLAPAVTRGMRVRYARTPNLWYVSSVEILKMPDGAAPPTAAERAAARQAASAPAMVAGFNLAAINAVTARNFAPVATSEVEDGDDYQDGDLTPFGKTVSTQALSDGKLQAVIVRLDSIELGGFAGSLLSMATSRVQKQMTQFAGPGDGGFWLGEENLIVADGSTRYLVRVTGDEEMETRQRVAGQIASVILQPPVVPAAPASTPAAGIPGGLAAQVVIAAAAEAAAEEQRRADTRVTAPTPPADSFAPPAEVPAVDPALAAFEPRPAPAPVPPPPPATQTEVEAPRRYTPPPIVYEAYDGDGDDKAPAIDPSPLAEPEFAPMPTGDGRVIVPAAVVDPFESTPLEPSPTTATPLEHVSPTVAVTPPAQPVTAAEVEAVLPPLEVAEPAASEPTAAATQEPLRVIEEPVLVTAIEPATPREPVIAPVMPVSPPPADRGFPRPGRRTENPFRPSSAAPRADDDSDGDDEPRREPPNQPERPSGPTRDPFKR